MYLTSSGTIYKRRLIKVQLTMDVFFWIPAACFHTTVDRCIGKNVIILSYESPPGNNAAKCHCVTGLSYGCIIVRWPSIVSSKQGNGKLWFDISYDNRQLRNKRMWYTLEIWEHLYVEKVWLHLYLEKVWLHLYVKKVWLHLCLGTRVAFLWWHAYLDACFPWVESKNPRYYSHSL
jgi:hypothetical protein